MPMTSPVPMCNRLGFLSLFDYRYLESRRKQNEWPIRTANITRVIIFNFEAVQFTLLGGVLSHAPGTDFLAFRQRTRSVVECVGCAILFPSVKAVNLKRHLLNNHFLDPEETKAIMAKLLDSWHEIIVPSKQSTSALFFIHPPVLKKHISMLDVTTPQSAVYQCAVCLKITGTPNTFRRHWIKVKDCVIYKRYTSGSSTELDRSGVVQIQTARSLPIFRYVADNYDVYFDLISQRLQGMGYLWRNIVLVIIFLFSFQWSFERLTVKICLLLFRYINDLSFHNIPSHTIFSRSSCHP